MAAKDVPNGDFCAYIDKLQEEKLAQFKNAVQKDATELKNELRQSQAHNEAALKQSINAALSGTPYTAATTPGSGTGRNTLMSSYSQTVNAARGERENLFTATAKHNAALRKGRSVPPNYVPLTQREMREAPNEFKAATIPPSSPAKGPLKLIGLIFFIITLVYMGMIAVFTSLVGAPPGVMFALTAAGLICMIVALQLILRKKRSRDVRR